jgi:hypothetical protein
MIVKRPIATLATADAPRAGKFCPEVLGLNV